MPLTVLSMHCSEKWKLKMLIKFQKIFFIQKTPEGTKIHWRGPTRSQGALVARPPPGPATWPRGGWRPPLGSPLRLYLPFVPKLHGMEPFSRNRPLCHCHHYFNLGRRSSYLFRHPAVGRRPSRRPLRRHDRLTDDV